MIRLADHVMRTLAGHGVTDTFIVTGVFGAFVDSLPRIVASGRVKRETMMSSYSLRLRQPDDQEVDIFAMTRPLTRRALRVRSGARRVEAVQSAHIVEADHTLHLRPHAYSGFELLTFGLQAGS